MRDQKNCFFLFFSFFIFILPILYSPFVLASKTPKTSKTLNISKKALTPPPSSFTSSKNPTNKTNIKPLVEKKSPVKDHRAIFPPHGKIPTSLVELGEGRYFSPYTLIMEKLNKTLSLWKKSKNGIQFISAYPADLGKKAGNKHVLGDLRTPEGIYFFQNIYEGPNLDFKNYGIRAFTMNYPNFFDRLDNKTGSGIWLHSIPDYESLNRGSRGCIVVRNNVIESLSEYIQIKMTPIIVHEKVQYISEEKLKSISYQVKKWLNLWEKAWENKNLKNYMAYYSEKFKSQGKNKRQWKTYKKILNEKYKFINISIKEPVIYQFKNTLVVRFLQIYKSDQITDFGEKVLYLIQKDPTNESSMKYEILGEFWTALTKNLIASGRS